MVLMCKKQSIHKWLLLIGVLMSLSITTIAAYLADGDSASNAITVGGNRISIEEVYEPEPIIPGDSIVKKVRIKNTGPNDCYVRIMAVFSDSDVGKYTRLDWNLKDWIYNEQDGYYYYPHILANEDVTSWLFTTLSFDEDLPEEMIKDVELIIYAESFQSEGFSQYEQAWKHFQMNCNSKGDNK